MVIVGTIGYIFQRTRMNRKSVLCVTSDTTEEVSHEGPEMWVDKGSIRTWWKPTCFLLTFEISTSLVRRIFESLVEIRHGEHDIVEDSPKGGRVQEGPSIPRPVETRN